MRALGLPRTTQEGHASSRHRWPVVPESCPRGKQMGTTITAPLRECLRFLEDASDLEHAPADGGT
eukprot:7109603-Lingulodinium_polyedra.AAC.1